MPASAPPPHASAPTLASRPLPERVRGLLGGILEYASDEIERTLVGMLNEFEQQLFKYAEQARSNIVQTRWLEAQRLVKRTRPDLVPRFLIALEAELACVRDPVGPKALIGGFRFNRDELALVDNLEMDEATVLTEVSGRIEVRNSLPLYLLGQRFGVLAGKPAFDAETLPVGPHALCRMLRQSAECLELGAEHRALLYRTFERHLSPLYGSFIESINTYLSRNGVLPNLHYVPVRARPSATTTGPAKARTAPGDEAAPAATAASGAGSGPGSGGGEPGPAGDDSFQQMRHLLAGRRQLLGKLVGGGSGGAARPANGNAVLVEPALVHEALGLLQKKPPAPVMVNGKPAVRTINHLKQDLLAQLRNATPDGKPPALPEEDSDAIDLVGMLFDHLMKDVRPNSPASNLLAKLQVPLLRVALQDKGFFPRQQHPARQMLNAIAETGAYWLGEDDADQQLVGKMQSVVDRTVREFDGDLGVFSNLLEDLSSHLQTVSRKAEVAEKRHVEAARGKERLALARDRAATVVEAMLKKQNLPRFTHTLLSQAWTDVMALTALRQGEDSDAWRQQLEIAERLVGVAKAGPGAAGIPSGEAAALQQDIQGALTQVGYHDEEAAAIAQRLVDPQGGAAADDDSAASRTELTMRLKARARLGEDLQESKKKKKVVLSPDEQARLDQIKHLPFGTWFEFTLNQQGEKVRRRLSWFSTVTGHVLFVNHRGQKVGEHTLEGLAKAMAQGQVKVVEEEKGTLIDRAWGTVMNALRSFAGQAKPGTEAPAR
ncbi:MAG: thymidine phosphorylase [Arenimonas sp.]|nr:thymidine phosphorylase [Arenimonas sp.]